MIRFKANGKRYSRETPLSVSDYLKEIKLLPKTVIVEYNKEFLQREFFESTFIKDNDSLEIVRAFAGG